MKEPRYAWVVVWAVFICLALIFGVSYSFAGEFDAQRADVSLVFGLSGLVYFVLGAGGGMLLGLGAHEIGALRAAHAV